jgi:hypothetical protein
MADINVNVVLPDPISVDVTSPTQALATNISVPGPQGPVGPQGPSGMQGLNAIINGITGSSLTISGSNGIIVLNSGVNTIFVSGNSGYFQDNINLINTNLVLTGSTLDDKINSLSGYSASISNLETTGSNLNSKINSLSGWSASDVNLANTGSTLDIKINNLSGNLTANYATIINLASTGTALDSKINSLSGSSASAINLANTGSTLDGKINSLSGNLTSTYSTILNLASTGSTLDSKINSLSGYSASIVNLQSTGSNLYSMLTGFSGNLDATYATYSQLATTGSTLSTRINNLSGYINSSSSNILFTTGNQIKSGRLTIGDTILNATNPYTLSLQSNNQDTFLEILNSGGLGKGAFVGMNDDNFELYNWQGGDIIFLTAENPSAGFGRLYIKNDGKIGIDTSSPSEKLEVVGNILANNLVYNTGNQNISGTKTFNLAPIISGNPFITGNLSLYATTINLVTTGSTLDIKINNLSGYVNSQDVSISNNLISTGSTLDNKINSLSGWSASAANLTSTGVTLTNNLFNTGTNLNTKINDLSGYVNIQDNTIFTNLYSTGNILNNKINSLSGYVNAQDTTISNNLNTTGSTLDNKINSLSGSSVLLYGNQSIGGVKTFRDNVYINNLFVTGTETIVSTNNFNVQSPYLILNITGGAVDGGIFFVTGAGLTGINDLGPIIGFDHTDKFKFGISSRGSDLSTLNDIAAVQDITAYSGFVDGKYATIINLASTGSILDTKINTLSGYSDDTFATITNLASTGSTLASNLASTGSTLQTNINTVSSNLISTGNNLEGKINSLSGTLTSTYATISNLASTGATLDSKIDSLSGYSNSTFATITNLASTGLTLNTKIDNLSGYVNSTGSNIVFTTGDQTISGIKTFNSRPTLNGTGFLLSGEGGAISLPSTIIYSSGFQIISGSKTFTGQAILNVTSGATLQLSGNRVLTTSDDIIPSATLYSSGFQIISGSKTFTGQAILNVTSGATLQLSGFRVLTTNDSINTTLPDTIIYSTGDQTISGIKTLQNVTELFFRLNAINSGLNIPLNSGMNFILPLTGNITGMNLLNTPQNTYAFTLRVDYSGSFAITWPTGTTGAILWPANTSPTLTAITGREDFFSFLTYTSGQEFFGFINGQNYSGIY